MKKFCNDAFSILFAGTLHSSIAMAGGAFNPCELLKGGSRLASPPQFYDVCAPGITPSALCYLHCMPMITSIYRAYRFPYDLVIP